MLDLVLQVWYIKDSQDIGLSSFLSLHSFLKTDNPPKIEGGFGHLLFYFSQKVLKKLLTMALLCAIIKTQTKGGTKMYSKKELQAALIATRCARDVLETTCADSDFYYKNDEVTKIFYELNDICIKLRTLLDKEEEGDV